MAEPVEIEILGHKARISWIKGQLADPLFTKKDSLVVRLELDEPIDGTISFGITIPVKNYSKEELRARIKAEAEESLRWSQERERRDKAARESTLCREKYLNHLGEQLLQMLSK